MEERHNCFISYKKEDREKGYLQKVLNVLHEEQVTGKALNKTIPSDDIDEVMKVIREEYLSNTSVTIFLIGENSSELEGLDYEGYNKQSFIIRELQASLYDGKNNRRSGILGIVLPEVESAIYQGQYRCEKCGEIHNYVNINDSTVIREFSANYYLKRNENNCCYEESGRFCVLVKLRDFLNNPNYYINSAYEKLGEPIERKVHWRDIEHKGKLK